MAKRNKLYLNSVIALEKGDTFLRCQDNTYFYWHRVKSVKKQTGFAVTERLTHITDHKTDAEKLCASVATETRARPVDLPMSLIPIDQRQTVTGESAIEALLIKLIEQKASAVVFAPSTSYPSLVIAHKGELRWVGRSSSTSLVLHRVPQHSSEATVIARPSVMVPWNTAVKSEDTLNLSNPHWKQVFPGMSWMAAREASREHEPQLWVEKYHHADPNATKRLRSALRKEHVSIPNYMYPQLIEDGAQVSYFASQEHFEADRRTSIKTGRFIKSLMSTADDETVKNLANAVKYAMELDGFTLSFEKGQEALRYAYSHGPESCAGREASYYSQFRNYGIRDTERFNTVDVYATDNISIATLLDEDGEIVARTLVVDSKKQYVRIYPTDQGHRAHQTLRTLLEANGYCRRSEALVGEHLKHIAIGDYDCGDGSSEPIIMRPYIDPDNLYTFVTQGLDEELMVVLPLDHDGHQDAIHSILSELPSHVTGYVLRPSYNEGAGCRGGNNLYGTCHLAGTIGYLDAVLLGENGNVEGYVNTGNPATRPMIARVGTDQPIPRGLTTFARTEHTYLRHPRSNADYAAVLRSKWDEYMHHYILDGDCFWQRSEVFRFEGQLLRHNNYRYDSASNLLIPLDNLHRIDNCRQTTLARLEAEGDLLTQINALASRHDDHVEVLAQIGALIAAVRPSAVPAEATPEAPTPYSVESLCA